MTYTLNELVNRMGLEVPPARDELMRWHSEGGEGPASFNSNAEIYLSADGRFLTVEVDNKGGIDEFYQAPAHVKNLYLQAEKIPGTSGFEVTKLNVDGYTDFDLTDGITADFALSIAFVSIIEIRARAEEEHINGLSHKFGANATETTGGKAALGMDIRREDNVIHVGNWPTLRRA